MRSDVPAPLAPAGLGPTEATRALLDGAPPGCALLDIERRTGLVGCRSDNGYLYSAMRTGPWMDADPGFQQAGSLAVFMDHALGEPAWFAVRPQRWSLTTELAIDIVESPPWTSEALHAVTRTHEVTSGAFTQCEVSDDAGRLIAVGSAWTQAIPAGPSPSPIARPNRLPSPGHSLAETFGLRTARSCAGTDVLLSEPRTTTNSFETIHGGVWATIAEVAASEELGRAGLRTTGIRVCYLRAASLDGPLTAEARPERLGRLFGVVAVTGRDSSGLVCIQARATGRRA